MRWASASIALTGLWRPINCAVSTGDSPDANSTACLIHRRRRDNAARRRGGESVSSAAVQAQINHRAQISVCVCVRFGICRLKGESEDRSEVAQEVTSGGDDLEHK